MQTHEVPTTLDAVVELFREARGDDGDAQWAGLAGARFALDDVRGALAHQALVELVPVIAENQEPAQDLFGDPREWAQACQAAWRADGVVMTRPSGPTSVRGFVHDLFFGAAVVAVVMTPMRMLVDGWRYDLNLALVLFPLLMGLGFLGLPSLWRALNRRRSRTVAVAGVVCLGVVYAGLVAGVFALGYPVSFGEGSGLWLLAVATGYGLVASVVGRRWPAPPDPQPAQPDETDEEWARGVDVALRERGDFTAARRHLVVAEATAHAAESGRALSEEFGPSTSYVARFAPDVVVRVRRSAWSWTAALLMPVLLLVMYLMMDGWGWQEQFIGLAVWFVAAAAAAVTSWRRYAALVRERRGASGDLDRAVGQDRRGDDVG